MQFVDNRAFLLALCCISDSLACAHLLDSDSAVSHMIALADGTLMPAYDYVVAAYGMRYEQRWHDVGCLFAFIFGLQGLHLLAMRNKVFLNR